MHAGQSFMSVKMHLLHPLYFDFAYEEAHTTTNYLIPGILWINILFTTYSPLVHVRHDHSCFDLANEFNPASIWVVSYIRGRELVESNATMFSYRCLDQKRDCMHKFVFIAC